MDSNRNFTDEMLKGPFASWRHSHQFLSAGSSTQLLDEVEWEGPFFSSFSPLFKWMVTRALLRTFRYRHRRLLHDLRRHEKYATHPRLKVGITGASGIIGRALSAFLSTGGHEVFHFVRRAPQHTREIMWSPDEEEIDAERMRDLDAVVHLAGENVAGGRWSHSFKRRILESRTRGTALVAKTLAALGGKPRHLISASAIGIYSDGFLGEVCHAWERALEPALNQRDLKVTIARIGVVMTSNGGALKELVRPTLLGLGGKIGDGTQPISWIALDDVLGALHELMLNPDAKEQAYDLVAKAPITQQNFSRALGKVLHRPSLVTTPAVLIKAVLGQMGEEVLLSGQAVEPTGLKALKFDFEFESLEDLLCFELGYER